MNGAIPGYGKLKGARNSLRVYILPRNDVLDQYIGVDPGVILSAISVDVDAVVCNYLALLAEDGYNIHACAGAKSYEQQLNRLRARVRAATVSARIYRQTMLRRCLRGESHAYLRIRHGEPDNRFIARNVHRLNGKSGL